MSTEKDTSKEETKSEYNPPKGAECILESKASDGKKLSYKAEADWIILRKDEKPSAEMFFTRYSLTDKKDRPVTFIFNGGPGASSVYLHFGAIGPRRAAFGSMGEPLKPPHKLVDNEETWLSFTDLVFIDPVGTGFSRMIPEKDKKKDEAKSTESSKKDIEYWGIKRDLESICEFIQKFLSRFKLWENPVYIAGESYGGFRTAKLTKMLQEDYGVPLAGAIIISPALEFSLLDASDYDALPWVDTFPVMAGIAAAHGLARKIKQDETKEEYAKRAEVFAVEKLLPVLAAGEMAGKDRHKRVLETAADFIGLPRNIVIGKNGRISADYFAKNLLRDRGLVLGLYDGTATVQDPYPDRDPWTGPDPTLHVIESTFASAVNTQIRSSIGLETEREYSTLSEEANENWKVDVKKHALESQIGSTDDLRYGMSINPHMKVFLTHGLFDLVTPYFAAERIKHLMKLDEGRKEMLTVKYYKGGHMFYVWEKSRKAFTEDMADFYAK